MTWQRDPGVNRTVPRSMQQDCFKRDHWACVKCGFTSRPNSGELNADHIIPSAEGGETTLENLETLCVPCHKKKTAPETRRGRQRRSGKRRPPLHPADALSS